MALKEYSTFFLAHHQIDFSVIHRTLVGEGEAQSSAEMQSVYSTAPADIVDLN